MLQGLRDSLKGTVIATVIVLFFIVPMVISGFSSGSWLSSVGGTDAASVNGTVISKRELDRQVYLQKQRMLSQEGVDPSADYLKDENLRQPVLDRLTKKAAMLTSAESAGMAASENQINSLIVNQPEFQKDGKFDPQTYRTLLGRIGSSPALYKADVAEGVVLEQIDNGLRLSSFVTPAEKDSLISIIHEQRSFFTVDIPSKGVAEGVEVADEEMQAYYQGNQSQFLEPERVEIEYIEMSVASLADQMDASDVEVKALFDKELESFDPKPEVEIAHILIEDGDSSAATIEKVKAGLAEGKDFAELAKEYSDDAGTKEIGGSLGTMIEGVFPDEVEQAVAGLNEGQVSDPIASEAGTHFIKVLSKIVPEPPVFEDRKDALASQVKKNKAEAAYVANLDLLEELTFSAADLKSASDELGLPVRTEAPFERTRGKGVATNPEIRNAAFSPEVLIDGHNSQVIELANSRAFVIRVKQHQPEHVLAFDEVKARVRKQLVETKVNQQLREKGDAFVALLKEGGDAKALAEGMGYVYEVHEDVTRSSPVADPDTRRLVFSTPVAEGQPSYQVTRAANGDFRVVAVTSQKPGSVDDVEASLVEGLGVQLQREVSRYEGTVFQAGVIANSEIEIN